MNILTQFMIGSHQYKIWGEEGFQDGISTKSWSRILEIIDAFDERERLKIINIPSSDKRWLTGLGYAPIFFSPTKQMSLEEGDISQMDLSYEPESEVEEEEENVPLAFTSMTIQPEPIPTEIVTENIPESINVTAPEAIEIGEAPVTTEAPPEIMPETQNTLPHGSTPVDGFQLVQATGLTDTSTPTPQGSEIPKFATPTPIPELKQSPPPMTPNSQPPIPAPPIDTNPLQDESKSKQFRDRSDFMIAEFFSRQVDRLTRGAPAALDRSYRFKERLGTQWAHITSQPEVEESIKRVQDMYDYFESLEKIVKKQQQAIRKVNEVESELAGWYRKEGISEPAGPIRDNMLYLSESYLAICHEREGLVNAYEQYGEFLTTFKQKAVGDALATMKKQNASRLELDAYGSKLGLLEERKLKTFAKAPSHSESSSLEKDLKSTRAKFQDAKVRYQNLSTSLIDKSGLLDLKKGVDFAAHIQKIREVHDKFNKGRLEGIPVLDEEDVEDEYLREHGVKRSNGLTPQDLAKEA